ncbi:DUF1850 domain-containing protein [Sporosarcina sp. HYO08]|uniref:DUF1850 domain-containing protein n=1 Tax=Sporosarcina sp. HYO08 TaxID=1759557 RepID=UPI0007936374|nr:DUF1850 domain-containing protein [Sporosarcina sp. HYO08]KXH79808.1 RocC [Sporosarcina sp. HYO08]
MRRKKIIPLILLVSFLAVTFYIPWKKAFIFTEQRSENPMRYFVPISKEQTFQIRYVHSIHLTDVIETYEVMEDLQIGLLSMQYEDVAIGLPSYAEEGETLTIENGLYTLTYDENMIDSFVLFIGDIDAELAFRYLGDEIDLKQHLIRGKSYKFHIQRLSFYQMLKGVNLNG